MLGSAPALIAQGWNAQHVYSFQDRDHDRDAWDTPPQEFREIQRQGFHDGVEGARKDFDHHKHPNVEDRAEYRKPPVPPSGQADYREGFRRGYQVAMDHMVNTPR